MKVNTDSVLLGAWAELPKNAKSGLDIGSGTGVLSLMLAQRNDEIKIVGVEIERNAYEESTDNYLNSPYSKRLEVVNLPLQEFVSDEIFDSIITNPPYFENNLKNKDENKKIARHTDSLSYPELIQFVESNLSLIGTFNVILPFTESEIFREIIKETSLHLNRIAFIKPNKRKTVNRVMMTFSKVKKKLEEETFCVYQSQGVYSERHHELTLDFYLDKK